MTPTGMRGRRGCWHGTLAPLMTSDESAARRAALIVGGHHGVVPSYSWDELRSWGGERCLNDPTEAAEILSEARQSLVKAVAGANSSAAAMAPGSLPVYASALSLAVVVLADWVASSREFLIAQTSATAVEPAARVGQAQRLTSDHLAKLALVPPRPPRALLSAAQLLPAAAQPTSLQASIQDHHPVSAPGITIITAPTGEGKTEAALLAASRYATAAGTAGWYFAMPTMGTADGLHSRLERILPALVEGPAPPLHLLHSLRRLRGEPTGWDAADPQARRWMTSDRKAFLAPCAVGTVDQALMAVLRTKHSPLRMLAAVSGVLIIDEAHVFDPYTQRLLRRLLQWAAAAGASVVVMSATLPHDLAVSFFDAYRDGTRRAGTQPSDSAAPKIDYPGWVAWTPEHGWSASSSRCAARSPRTLTFRTRRTSATDLDTEISERALDASSDGGCVMIVRETVAKAQRTFELLDSISPDRCETLLLHSRFRHDDRRSAAEDLLERLGPPPSRDRPDRLVLVATQIVELSLDVDFDLVLSDLAPMAALLQRAGRCHRHNRRSRPPAVQTAAVEVFIPVDSDGDVVCRSAVYLTHDLRQSVSLLPDTGRVVSVPGDIPDLVNGAHIDINDDSDDYQQWLAENDLKSSLAAAAVIPCPLASRRENAARPHQHHRQRPCSHQARGPSRASPPDPRNSCGGLCVARRPATAGISHQQRRTTPVRPLRAGAVHIPKRCMAFRSATPPQRHHPHRRAVRRGPAVPYHTRCCCQSTQPAPVASTPTHAEHGGCMSTPAPA